MPLSEKDLSLHHMISLKNNTKSNSKVGYLVSIDPRDPNSFVYTVSNSIRAIGVVTQSVPYRALCKIATIGDKAKVYVTNNINKDDIIRASKSDDNTSLGTCVKAKSGDAPYLKIGDALSSGKGLIPVILELTYLSNSSISGSDTISIPTVFPYTITSTDSIVIVDSAIAVTVNLTSATGSSRKLQIKSIGTGEVTVEGNSTDLIDGQLNQSLTQWDCIDVEDYVTNNWVIT